MSGVRWVVERGDGVHRKRNAPDANAGLPAARSASAAARVVGLGSLSMYDRTAACKTGSMVKF